MKHKVAPSDSLSHIVLVEAARIPSDGTISGQEKRGSRDVLKEMEEGSLLGEDSKHGVEDEVKREGPLDGQGEEVDGVEEARVGFAVFQRAEGWRVFGDRFGSEPFRFGALLVKESPVRRHDV